MISIILRLLKYLSICEVNGVGFNRPYPFLFLQDLRYLEFQKKDAFLLKLVNFMHPINVTPSADIIQQIEQCQYKVNLCEDVIKQLSGVTSDGSILSFSFSVRDMVLVRLSYTENETEFVLSFFMSWLQRYRRTLADLKGKL